MNQWLDKREQFALAAIVELKERYSKQELWSKFKPDIIRDSCLALNIELFPKQNEIISNGSKIKVVRAARRTAKSFNTAFISYCLMKFCSIFDYDFHIKFAGPRAEDCRHIWEHLHKFLDAAPILSPKVEHDNWHSNSTNKKQIIFEGGSWIKSASCDMPEMNDIRGDFHDFLAVDEFGQIKYKNAFLEAAMYSLKDKEPLNQLMVVGTFDVVGMGQEFDHLFKLGQDEERADIQSWTLKGSDNPHSDQDAAKTARDIVTDEGYLREEMGEGVPPHGRLLPDFNAKTQVTQLTYNIEHPLLIGVDFGFRKPVVLFLSYYDGHIRAHYELSLKDIRADAMVNEIRAVLLAKFHNKTPLILGCDKAGDKENDVVSLNSFKILKMAFPMAQYTHHSQLVSKANQVILLKALTMQDRIWVDESCEQLIRSLVMASPDTTRTGAVNSPGWKKEKGIDDPLDALCYALINFGPTSELIIPREPEPQMTSMERQEKISAFF